jgi:hypothetical protein
MFWGWRFALGFVIILFVHEMGHVAVLRAQGVPASAPCSSRSWVRSLRSRARSVRVAEEAWSGDRGPIVGAVGALVTLQFAELNGSLLLRALAYTRVPDQPVQPDPRAAAGRGRVAGALHPAVLVAGEAGAVVLLLTFHSPVMILVHRAPAGWRSSAVAAPPGPAWTRSTTACPASTPPGDRRGVPRVAALCVYGMHLSYVPRPPEHIPGLPQLDPELGEQGTGRAGRRDRRAGPGRRDAGPGQGGEGGEPAVGQRRLDQPPVAAGGQQGAVGDRQEDAGGGLHRGGNGLGGLILAAAGEALLGRTRRLPSGLHVPAPHLRLAHPAPSTRTQA